MIRQADPQDVENPAGWLTTAVARVCPNMPRSREHRRDDEIAPLIEKTPAATRQLASRAAAGWSAPTSPRPGAATSTHCSPCSTPTSCGPTARFADLVLAGGKIAMAMLPRSM
ncbi:hypothetical protein [Streptomyces sp. NPDC001536]|uniref:hypothetical protein n=1 Tax=Streptomyces sp. NPDC001536 TaxID=3364583 RepID=UPI00369DDF9E